MVRLDCYNFDAKETSTAATITTKVTITTTTITTTGALTLLLSLLLGFLDAIAWHQRDGDERDDKHKRQTNQV